MSQAIEISIESADESPSEDPRQRSHTLRVLSPRKIRGERSKSPNPRQMPRNDSDNDNDDAVSDSKDPKDDGGLSADAKRDWRQSLRISRFSGNFNFTRPSSQSKTLRDLDFEPPTTPSRCASFAELIDGMGFEALQKMAKSQIQQIEELKQKLHLQEMANSSFSEEAREFSQPTMAGWMQKQGHLRKTWLRRFFILQGNQLIYQYEIKGPVKRSYMLDQVSVEVIDYQGLETIQLTSEGVVSYLRAESPDTNSTWMHYIESQIAYSRYLEKMRTLNIPADPRVKRYFQKIHSGSLALDNCILRPETAEALLVPFKSTCFLQRLSLINAGIDETNIIEVCKAIQANNSLVMISLDDNSINDEGVILLSRAIRVKETVATVSLKQNKISAIGFARFMVHSFENRSLAEVNFSFNQITSDGFRKLYDLVEQAPEFQPGSLYKLIIHRNDITSEGVEWLSKLYQDRKCPLKDIDLSDNKIDDTAAESLVKVMQDQTSNLKTLSLARNQLGKGGILKLTRAFLESKMISLDLGSNHLKLSEFAHQDFILNPSSDEPCADAKMHSLRFVKDGTS